METMCRTVAQASARRLLFRATANRAFHSAFARYAKRSTIAVAPEPASTRLRSVAAVKKVVKEWPRPATIPFQAKVANSVELMGYIHMPVQFKEAPDGKVWAGTVITQSKDITSDPTCLWIPILFEGDMAHVAACHLKLNDHVHLTGRLSADPPPVFGNEAQASVQVIVQSFNFVEGHPQKQKSIPAVSMKKYEDPASAHWRDLLDNPKQWWDYRISKRNGLVRPKHPDFKSKVGELSLWLTDAPAWVLSQLGGVEFDVREVKAPKGSKGDQSWKDLVENPEKWWDTRFEKINPRYPDFKHKETGEALWLNASPTWVLSKLPPPKNKPNAANREGTRER